MLILTRKPGEVIYIGDTVKVTLVEIKGNQVRLGIDAPNDLRIYRKEIYDQIQEENKMAAGADLSSGGLEGLTAAWGDDGGEGKKVPDSSGQKPRAVLPGLTTAKVKAVDASVVVRKKKERNPDE